MKIKHGKDVLSKVNCIIYKQSEYFYRIQIGYDLSCDLMGETKNAITTS